MIRTSSALLNFDRLDQSLSNCKMDQSWRVEHYGLISLPLLSSISCRPAWGLSLLIECINIGCGDGSCVRTKNENYFSNCLFRISLMDKMVILSGNWIYAWWTFDSLAPGTSGQKNVEKNDRFFPRSGEVQSTSGDWKFNA